MNGLEFVLEGYLLNPPPDLVHMYLSHLLSEGALNQFEQSITKFPIETLDLHQVFMTFFLHQFLHQVLTACRENNLFDGTTYVLNRALNDYIGPLEEMFDCIRKFANKQLVRFIVLV